MTGSSWVSKFIIKDTPKNVPSTKKYMDDKEFETGITKESPVDKVHVVELPDAINWPAIFLNMKRVDGGLRQGRVDAAI